MNEPILVVEDELIVANDIRRTLEKAQYKVTALARSVEQAMAAIAVEKPFLVILDIYLEGTLTGIDMAIHLNRMEIPFVYLSANSNQQILEKANITAPYGFIVKPFREKDLIVSLDIARYRIIQDKEIKNTPSFINEPISAKNGTPTANGSKLLFPNFEGIIGNSLRMKNVFSPY